MSEIILNEERLTDIESSRLQELEETIKKNFLGFVAVGKALAEIRDKRLYRNDEGRTFDAYCAELWDMCKDYAYKLIGAAQVIENLSTIVDKSKDNQPTLLPVNEAQARELVGLTPKEQQQVWQQVVEQSDGGKVTAKLVKNAVKTFKGERLEKQLKKSSKDIRKNTQDKQSSLFIEAWEVFWNQVEEERKANWRNTSRKVVLNNLALLTDMLSEDKKKESQSPACSMILSDREKLHKAGYRIFRMNPKELLIEQWHGGSNWIATDSFKKVTEMKGAFDTLMEDPKNLRA